MITMYNNRTYRVCSVNMDKTPKEVFSESKGGDINFIEYYEKNYNIKIKDESQPLLTAVPSNFEKKQKTKKIYLIPELCYMTGLTQAMQRDFNAKRVLIQKTQLPPKARVERFRHFLKLLSITPEVQEEQKKWQVEYDHELLHVPGTLLAPERIVMGRDRLRFDQASADFTREMRGKSMYKTCSLSQWYILFTQRDSSLIFDFTKHVESLARQYGELH